jgi:hypothetical protein
MHEPQHMLSKLLWEIDVLTKSMSVWVDNEQFPVPIFGAVTAWHITDWLWQSSAENRNKLAKRYKFAFTEGTPSGIGRGLERFQEAVAKDSRHLFICREIANGSKHMRRKKIDPDVRAAAKWHKAVENVGLVKAGDLVMSLLIKDREQEHDANYLLIEAFGYWEQLFMNEKFISAKARLPDKIIKVAR